MIFIQKKIRAGLPLLFVVFFLQIGVANATTFTYEGTIPTLDKLPHPYLLEYVSQAQDSSCLDLHRSWYDSSKVCLANKPPAGTYEALSSDCMTPIDVDRTYTSNKPLCSSSIARFNLKQTSGPKPTVSAPGGTTKTDTVSAPGGTTDVGGDSGRLVNPLNSISSLPELLTAILKGVVEIGAIFLTLMLVYVGFLFVAAQGNAEKLSSARSALIWTIIGGLILLGAEAISLVIQATVKTL